MCIRDRNHGKHRENARNAGKMGLKWGGGQKTPRSTFIDPKHASSLIGSGEAKQRVGDETVDKLLKPGETQHFAFQAGVRLASESPRAHDGAEACCLCGRTHRRGTTSRRRRTT